jgi:hypothetical protein
MFKWNRGGFMKVYVNWFTEGLASFYEDDNQGLVHGVYVYEDEEDFPIDVFWFATEEEALQEIEVK